MEVPSNGGVQKILTIPEGDVYRLIMRSKLPAVGKFESWVMDDEEKISSPIFYSGQIRSVCFFNRRWSL